MDFDGVFERIKKVTGWRTQSALADHLGITQGAIGGAKTRGKFPLEWAWKISQEFGVSFEFIMKGKDQSFGDFVREDGVPYLVKSADDERLKHTGRIGRRMWILHQDKLVFKDGLPMLKCDSEIVQLVRECREIDRGCDEDLAHIIDQLIDLWLDKSGVLD